MHYETIKARTAFIAFLAFAVLGINAILFEAMADGYLATLAVPLSALLGYRFGKHGLMVVVAGGVFLLPEFDLAPGMRLLPLFDLYLVSLATCMIAATRDSWRNFLPKREYQNRFLPVFFLLPVTIGIWQVSIGDGELQLTITLSWLAFAFLFLAGVARVDSYKIGILLITVAIASFCLTKLWLPYRASDFFAADRADLPIVGLVELSGTYVSYYFDTVTGVIAGAFYYAAGRVCGPFIVSAEQPPDRSARLLVGLLVLFAADVIPLDWAAKAMDRAWEFLESLMVTETIETTVPGEIMVRGGRYSRASSPGMFFAPLVGFVPALLFRYRGFLVALLASSLLWIVPGIFRGYFPGLAVPVGSIFVMLGYAAFGVAVRNDVLDSEDRWWSAGWAIYIALFLVLLIRLGLPIFSAYLPLVVVAVVGIGLGATRLQAWLRQQKEKPHAGWVTFLASIGLLYVIWSQFGAMSEAVKRLASAAMTGPVIDEFESWWMVAIGWLFLVWLALTALQSLTKLLPECIKDVRHLAQAIGALMKGNSLPVVVDETAPGEEAPEESLQESPEPMTERTPWWYLAFLMQKLRNGVAWVSIIIVLAAFGRSAIEVFEGYREEYREEIADESVFEPRQANEYLMDAANYELGDWGIERIEAGGYSTVIVTQWYSSRGTPDVRQRAKARINEGLSERSISVSVDMQRKNRGLWVESNDGWRQERAIADELESGIFDRARRRSERDQ